MKFLINQYLEGILLHESQYQFQLENSNIVLSQIMITKKIIFQISIANMTICKPQSSKF